MLRSVADIHSDTALRTPPRTRVAVRWHSVRPVGIGRQERVYTPSVCLPRRGGGAAPPHHQGRRASEEKRAAHIEVSMDRHQRREMRRLERIVGTNLRPPAAHTSIAAPTPAHRLRAQHTVRSHTRVRVLKLHVCVGQSEPKDTHARTCSGGGRGRHTVRPFLTDASAGNCAVWSASLY